MKAKLVGVIGWDSPSDIELVLPMVLGRSRSADLRIQQSLVSRRHSEFYEQDGRLMVRDLGSTNGTRVNQVKIDTPTELLSGDLVTLGSITFRVDCDDHPATLADSKDETAIALRTDLDQLLRIPAGDSSRFDTVPEETYLASAPGDGAPIGAEFAASHPPPADADSNATLFPPQDPAGRSDALPRKSR